MSRHAVNAQQKDDSLNDLSVLRSSRGDMRKEGGSVRGSRRGSLLEPGAELHSVPDSPPKADGNSFGTLMFATHEQKDFTRRQAIHCTIVKDLGLPMVRLKT